jgi:hypothetical protein
MASMLLMTVWPPTVERAPSTSVVASMASQ